MIGTLCEGDSVVRQFYGDGKRLEARWWGYCAECGDLVAVLFAGGDEFPSAHWSRLRPTSEVVDEHGT